MATRRTWLWAIAGAVVVLGIGAAALVLRHPPKEVTKLEQAQRAGSRAQSTTVQIAHNLRRIAQNLKAGAELSQQGGRIEHLTQAQQQSLADLTALLRGQLRSLRTSSRTLEGTKRSASSLAHISDRQAQLIAQAVTALRRLEGYAARAGATSADLTRKAIYGARLAEQSQRSFSRR